MRLLMIGSAPISGLLYHPTRMAFELHKRGVEVHVCTWGVREQSPGLRAQLEAENIAVHRLDCLERYGWRALVGGNRELHECVRIVQPDAVHVFGAVTSFQASDGGRNHQGNGIRHPRMVAMVASMGSASKYRFLTSFGAMLLNRYADAVIAQCQSEYTRLVNAGIPPERLHIIPTPLDCYDFCAKATAVTRDAILARYSVPCNSKLLGCFANLKFPKRQDHLIRAFSSLPATYGDWRLVLAGEGPAREHYQRLADQQGLGERVHFLGRIPNEDVAPMQAAMDAVAHCSIAETFGYNSVEPLLLRKPTLLTRVGFAHEIEQAGHAVVVAPDNLDELRHGLERVMAPDAGILARAASAPEFVRRNLDVPVVMDRLMKVYGG